MQTTAIIAAYNEEDSIGEVLEALTKSPLIDEIIVVSDGSTDRTVEIARSFDVRTIALRENRGKGYAMNVGVEHASHRLLFFVDGDMLNVSSEHIQSLILPVRDGLCDMNVGVRHRGPVLDFFHLQLHVGPVLSGIRVMLREVFECVPSQYRQRFQIETALNFFAARAGFRQTNTVIYDLGHIIKETKRGVLSGLSSRWDMSREVFLVQCDLYLFQGWRWVPSEESPVVSEYELFEAELFE
ncbi:MAG: glycosyltransferase family 2 protein [Acidobacteriota bacterium]